MAAIREVNNVGFKIGSFFKNIVKPVGKELLKATPLGRTVSGIGTALKVAGVASAGYGVGQALAPSSAPSMTNYGGPSMNALFTPFGQLDPSDYPIGTQLTVTQQGVVPKRKRRGRRRMVTGQDIADIATLSGFVSKADLGRIIQMRIRRT